MSKALKHHIEKQERLVTATQLTDQERRILDLLCEDTEEQVIADTLKITRRGVRDSIESMGKRTNCSTHLTLAVWYCKHQG